MPVRRSALRGGWGLGAGDAGFAGAVQPGIEALKMLELLVAFATYSPCSPCPASLNTETTEFLSELRVEALLPTKDTEA